MNALSSSELATRSEKSVTPSEAHLALRLEVLRHITANLRSSGLDESQARKRCGLSRKERDDLVNERVERLSTELLVGLTGTLGMRLRFVLEPVSHAA